MLWLKTECAKLLYFAAMQKAKGQKAVFLDRDGVINHDEGTYTFAVDAFEILPGVLEKLRHWTDQGFKLMIFTNQAGVAKGLYSREDVEAVHQYLQGQCVLHGFAIDSFYFCPHHEDYSGKCLCRKPGSLMLEKALHHFGLQPENCVMIGDKPRDIQAAESAGVKGILVETNAGLDGVLLDEV